MGHSKEKRIDYIKGIGILFILLGHTPEIPIELRKVIYSFHMPQWNTERRAGRYATER